MSIPASAVSSLRQRTGVSITACKAALEKSGGDEEKAIEILRKEGIVQAAKKATRDQYEGRIFLESSDKKSAMILLGCETDFVARDENFQTLGKNLVHILLTQGKIKSEEEEKKRIPEMTQKLGENISIVESHVIEAPIIGTYVHSNGKIGVMIGLNEGNPIMARDVAMHAAAMNPTVISPEDIPDAVLIKEKEIWKEQLTKEGKNSQIIEKIIMGKEKKFREEHALLKQNFVKEPDKKIEEYLGNSQVIHYIRVEAR